MVWYKEVSVLLWKHAVVRKRRFFITLLEFLSPVIMFFIIFSMREQIIGDKINIVQQNTWPEELLNQHHHEYNLLFSPSTSQGARDLMNRVAETLKIDISDVHGYQNETELLLSENLPRLYDSLAVIFEDFEMDQLPDKLNYKIRQDQIFLVDQIKSFGAAPGPHENYGTNYDWFVQVKTAIDKAYLEMKSGKSITQKLFSQQFPYPAQTTYPQLAIMVQYDILLPLATIMGQLFLVVTTITRLCEERFSGIKELMKMMGVTPTTLWLSHFINCLAVGVVFVVVSTVCMKATEDPLVATTDTSILAITLLLYFVYVTVLTFACSTLFVTQSFSVLITSIFWIGTFVVACKLSSNEAVINLIWFVYALVPNMPILWFYSTVAKYETEMMGVQWSTVARAPTHGNCSVLFVWLALLVNIVLCCVFTWYMDNVKPGLYGLAKPWNFFCKKQYWTQQRVAPEEIGELEKIHRDNDEYFEKAPQNSEVGIRISSLWKVFSSWGASKTTALSDINLDIYKGEITILLGHNGAGKTTLMSIITGMFKASSGSVYVNGLKSTQNMSTTRQSMGLCPQHNLTFSDLTVREHLIFFALLKDSSLAHARSNCQDLLDRLKLADKADCLTSALSGGMKRRVQLACALSGKTDVLILDEPTSGLDVETRRELWDLLLSFRGSRTVLLTTHFMEEADALGDRVAIVQEGRLRCHGTPMFLKKAFGTGYRLSITTKPQYDEKLITGTVKEVLPAATLHSKGSSLLNYRLPSEHTGEFPALFDKLEMDKQNMGIVSIGVGVTTLEEVFLNLSDAKKLEQQTIDYEGMEDTQATAPPYVPLTGATLLMYQIQALLNKHFIYRKTTWMTGLVVQIFFPLAIAIISVLITNNLNITFSEDTTRNILNMNLNIYEAPESKILYSITDYDEKAIVRSWRQLYPKMNFIKSQNITNDILEVGYHDIFEYKNMTIGIELSRETANALYSTQMYHARPVAVNFLMNTLATILLPSGAGNTVITTYNEPLDGRFVKYMKEAAKLNKTPQPKSMLAIGIWAALTCFGLLVHLAPTIALHIKERVTFARQSQIMCGVSARTYWGVSWMWTFADYCMLVFVVITCVAILDTEKTLTRLDFLASVCLLWLVFGAACTAFLFILSFLKDTTGGGLMQYMFCIILFGNIVPSTLFILENMAMSKTVYWWLFATVGKFFPMYNLMLGTYRAGRIARDNAQCALDWPDIADQCALFNSPNVSSVSRNVCCNRKCYGERCYGPYYYLSDTENNIATEVIILAVEFVIYMMIVFALDEGKLKRLWDKIRNYNYIKPALLYRDVDVVAERTYVHKKLSNGGELVADASLAFDLHKNYRPLFKPACNAVKGVSFSVKRGECFGLLGVNGAGKSSIFKILTSDEPLTMGQINVNNYDVNKNRQKYLSALGYCPQFGGLNTFLTGREHIELVARLRGVPSQNITSEVNNWLECLGLKSLADVRCRAYSGGCARRLCAALALVGGPKSALLDEPSAGVDAAARRTLWAAIRGTLRAGSSVVISSHSMEETENLCGRIGIMSAGELGALGSAAELRASRARGFTAQIKLHAAAVTQHARGDTAAAGKRDSVVPMMEQQYNMEDINKLRDKMEATFNCELKDQHQTMLLYHIDEREMRYGELFAKMETLKQQYQSLIEDYTISETTLEEVFLSFAKDSRQLDTQQQMFP